jgi:hypothetical protein
MLGQLEEDEDVGFDLDIKVSYFEEDEQNNLDGASDCDIDQENGDIIDFA